MHLTVMTVWEKLNEENTEFSAVLVDSSAAKKVIHKMSTQSLLGKTDLSTELCFTSELV